MESIEKKRLECMCRTVQREIEGKGEEDERAKKQVKDFV
jgi:hypothetical protein